MVARAHTKTFAKPNSDFFSHCCCCLAEKDMLCRYVFWYHFERMVNYDLPSDSSVSVKTSTSAKGMTRSILTIKEAQPEDAGNYTCKPSNAIAASIQVFVSEGSYFIISVNLCGILVAIHTIRKVKFLSKNSILTKLHHFHEFFTKKSFDKFSREIKVVNS